MTDKPKVLKSKTKKIYKSNKLNKAGFIDYNLNDYRVYLNAIALIGGVDVNGKYLQEDHPSREYTLSAVDFAKQFNIEPNNAYKILKQAVDKLINTHIKVEKPDMFTTTVINVCELAHYNHKDGTITVLFTGSIMEHLKQQIGKGSQFTLYNLSEITNLTSLYSVRLYELIQQFKTGFMIYTVDQWRDIFGISPEQYKMYHQIKQKVFNQALNEINIKTGYRLTMSEEKNGRKVIRVKFDFAPVVIHSGVDHKTGEQRSRHIKPKKPRPKPNVDPESTQQELEI